MRRVARLFRPFAPLYLGLIALVWVATLVEETVVPTPTPVWGVTFMPQYAAFLGTDPRESLAAMLDDLGVRHFRLAIPWDRAEPSRGQFTFEDIEWQLDALAARDADAVVAIGRRTPRWPECHDPDWLAARDADAQDAATLSMLRAVVDRLKGREEIVAWQVENEPLLAVFGDCPRMRRSIFWEEVRLVRSLDPSRPVLTTESGELSTWLRTAPFVDRLGISVYRQTWNRWLGKIVYPLSPAFYRRRAESVRGLFGNPIFVSELQAEPWARAPLPSVPLAEQLRLFDAGSLWRMAEFAQATRLSPAFFWGAEWWYWLRTQGHPELWAVAREIFRE